MSPREHPVVGKRSVPAAALLRAAAVAAALHAAALSGCEPELILPPNYDAGCRESFFLVDRTAGEVAFHPSWTPQRQGRGILYSASDRTGRLSLWYTLVNDQSEFSTTAKMLDVSGQSIVAADWAPNGQWIAYSMLPWNDLSGTPPQLYLTAPFASERRPLGQGYYPVFAPDGGSVAYIATAERASPSLVVRDVSGGVPDTLARNVVVERISWSANGERIAYVIRGGSRQGVIRVYDFRTRQSADVTRDSQASGLYPDESPSLSPDGKYVVYTQFADAVSRRDLFVVNVATGNRRRLTSGPTGDTSPAFNRSGSEVVFIRDGKPYTINVCADRNP
jgi:Tol biopolymer transport system component